MAIVNAKVTALFNADNNLGKNNRWLERGPVYESVGTLEKLGADSNNSVYRFLRVSSNWVINSILLTNDAITGMTAVDCGLYDVNTGAAVSQALFATGQDLSSARTSVGLNLRFVTSNIDTTEKQLWQLLGLSEDPQKQYDLCLTATTAGAGAGTIDLMIRYTG